MWHFLLSLHRPRLLQTKSLFHFLFIRWLRLSSGFICSFRSRQTFVQLLPSDQNARVEKRQAGREGGSERAVKQASKRTSNGKRELNKNFQGKLHIHVCLHIYRWYFSYYSELIWFPCTLHTFGIWCANRVVEHKLGMHVCIAKPYAITHNKVWS